jgi:nucleoside-diphosphate-sugar epimerase
MRVFITGATGALGRRLVPKLVGRSHEVVGMTTTEAKVTTLWDHGATPVVGDVLDRDSLVAAVVAAAPEVVVHQATALAGMGDLRRFDAAFAQTNRLRTEGTDNLIEAARRAGARRIVAQSFAGWPYEPEGGPVKSEEDPLQSDPPKQQHRSLAAIRHLEHAVTHADGLEGVALRYGGFYGPGTSIDGDAEHAQMIRKRRFPIVGDGGGVWSFVHIDDAATATVTAIEGGAPGVFNVADDEPAPVREWLPVLAEALGAPPPRRVPAWVARPLAGRHGVQMMTVVRGASNAKFKRQFGWMPSFPTWREGFKTLR